LSNFEFFVLFCLIWDFLNMLCNYFAFWDLLIYRNFEFIYFALFWFYWNLMKCACFAVNNPKKSGPMLNETFLGLLYPIENYKVWVHLLSVWKILFDLYLMEWWKIDEFHFLFRNVICSYGYLTNTKVKFILVTTDLDVKDADVRNVSINKSLWFSFVSLV
jgi:hypothetical protein